LNKVYAEQEKPGTNKKTGKDFEEDPMHSPEYSIVHALDDSCVLFTVNEDQEDPRIRENNSDNTSHESTQKLISPALQ
jgi:hypothetical protein